MHEFWGLVGLGIYVFLFFAGITLMMRVIERKR